MNRSTMNVMEHAGNTLQSTISWYNWLLFDPLVLRVDDLHLALQGPAAVLGSKRSLI